LTLEIILRGIAATKVAPETTLPGTARAPTTEVDVRSAGSTRFQLVCGDGVGKVSKTWSTSGRRAVPGISRSLPHSRLDWPLDEPLLARNSTLQVGLCQQENTMPGGGGVGDKVLADLEFDRVLALLAAQTSTPPGASLATDLRPSYDASEVLRENALTAEAARLAETRGALPFGTVPDPQPLLPAWRSRGASWPRSRFSISSP